MSNKEDEGKLELSLRVLGNEIIGFSCNCVFKLGNGNIRTYVNADIQRIRNGTNTTKNGYISKRQPV